MKRNSSHFDVPTSLLLFQHNIKTLQNIKTLLQKLTYSHLLNNMHLGRASDVRMIFAYIIDGIMIDKVPQFLKAG